VELAERAVIRPVGETTRGRWPAKLWLPGDAA